MRQLVHRGRFGLLLAALITTALAQASSQTPAGADTVFFRIVVVESQEAATQVIDALKRGENLVSIAARVSIDPSAANGGLVGPVAVADLRPEIRSALDSLRAGDISGVVRLPTGFAVLKRVPDAEAGAGALFPASGATSPMASAFTSALGSTGSVKYVYDLSGYVETVLSLRQVALPPDARDDLATLCQVRAKLVSSAQTLVADALASASGAAQMAPIDRAQARVLEGQLHAFRGDMAAAIRALEDARRIAVAQVPDLRLQLIEALGIAHLHKAELDNGLHERPGDRCLLSARPGSRLANVADVTKAIEYFTAYLVEQPDELEVRWLLNIAHMFAGTYPDSVPRAQLIPPGAFESGEDVGRFVDVASRAGLHSVSMSGGVIVDDFDKDGRLDVVTSSIDSCAPLRLFHRNEDGTFTDRATQAGLATQLGGLNIVQTDYNNDGHLDILVLRGGWETPQRKSLLRNNGDGTFTDVTVASGLAKAPTGTQAAVWTDIDNDGFLDLFVGNENGPAQLFRNNRNGTFDDIAEKAGVARRGFNKGVAAADYDNDGWPDLYVSNLGGTNFLYRNNRDGTFSEFGRGAGAPGPGQGFPTWFFDYDNDGFQDLFVGSFVTSVDEAARAYLHLPRNGNTLKLYRNLGDGSFQDMTRQAGLDKVLMVMGANFGDIDNDGFLDIYLGTGNPSYASLVPSLLLAQPRPFDRLRAGGAHVRGRDRGVGHWRAAQGARRRVCRSRSRRRSGDRLRGRRRHARRRARAPAVREPWAQPRLDCARADRREDQPGGDWRPDHRHGRGRRWSARHAPQRRQRRILRRVAAPAADRPRPRGAACRRGDLVADEQLPSTLLERGQEPVSRDH